MMPHKLLSINREESGFTLPELLIGVLLTSVLCSVMAMIIIQTNNVVLTNRNHMVSVNQVHNAGYWIQVDTKMAQTVDVDAGASGLPLTLSWTEWDNTNHEVIYAVQNNTLQRIHSVNNGSPITTAIARSVDPASDMTNCQFVDGVLTFKLTSTEGSGPQESSETRTFKFEPRSG